MNLTKPILRWQGSKARMNDSPFTRELFSDCNIHPVITQNRAVNTRTHGAQTFGELIITPK